MTQSDRRANRRLPAVWRAGVERLERRDLLSATIGEDAVAMIKSGPLAKGGQPLREIVEDYRAFMAQAAATTSSAAFGGTFAADRGYAYDVDADGVLLDVRIAGDFASGLAAIERFGGRVVARSEAHRAASVRVAIDRSEAFVSLPVVEAARMTPRPILGSAEAGGPLVGGGDTATAGVAMNQADRVLKTDVVRQKYRAGGTGPFVTGAGIKIGVLSDTVNRFGGGLAASQATGDLPPGVELIEDGPANGSDEGRAMMELIHDIAPGSSLAFATAFVGGQLGFAENITSLFDAGARIIVDDVSYPNEPMFQAGVIDLAINAAVNGGAWYFSATGNSGRTGYRVTNEQFYDNYLDLDPGAGIDTSLAISVTSTLQKFVLQWDDRYNGLPDPSGITTDLDFYVFDRYGNLVALSNDNNFATGQPVEFIGNLPTGQYSVRVKRYSGGTPDAVQMVAIDGGFSAEYVPESQSTTYGHASGPWTISVGAVPFYKAPPYSTATPIRSESFSSAGKPILGRDKEGSYTEYFWYPTGPYLSAPDGTNTTFFGYDITNKDGDAFPNFFGTSAAAPNLAAGAALMREAFPAATQVQVAHSLAKTARPLNGTPRQIFNAQGGFGLADVNAAMAKLASTIHLGVLMDDGDAGFTTSGPWVKNTTGGYSGDHRTLGKGKSGYAAWVFDSLPDGNYEILTMWKAGSGRSYDATYKVWDGGELVSQFAVDQRIRPVGPTVDGKVWQSLGIVTIANGQLLVRLDGSPNGSVDADALRIVRSPSPLAPNRSAIPAIFAAFAASIEQPTRARHSPTRIVHRH